ncbi:MAG: ribose-5-phosphate isomerase RpiA [Candidatus Halichondribacter symbioticus]
MNIEELQKLSDDDKAKIFAAWHALAEVKDGMKIGIGTGSTASWFVKLLAGKQSKGLTFRACATSSQTKKLAKRLGIKIESLDAFEPVGDDNDLQSFNLLNLVIDGADEFDTYHNLIKGGGGALLQEKMTARSAARFIVITDASKEVERLGAFPLPVEIVRFAWKTTLWHIGRALEASKTDWNKIRPRRVGNKIVITDEGHYILDLHLKSIANPYALDKALQSVAGVMETGFFVGTADVVIMADSTGLVKSRETGGDWVKTQYDLADLAEILADIPI